jgi:peptidoglycan glycosyltransferase
MSPAVAIAIAGTVLLVGFTLWSTSGDERSRANRTRQPDPQRRALLKLGLVLSIGLVGLVGRLLFVSVIRARSIRTKSGADASGDVLSNPRVIAAALNADRGSVTDRGGTVLAENVQGDGHSERVFHDIDAAHLLGYFSPLRYGLDGIERSRNEALSGTDPLTVKEAIKSTVRLRTEGHDVRLTIDSGLQHLAASLLSGVTGSATLIEPRTGRILAMASSPAYNPNTLTTNAPQDVKSADAAWQELLGNDNRPLLMRPTSGLYPPGSTFKVFTAASAIEAGAIQRDTVFEDNGSLTVDGRVIPEFNRPDESQTRWTATEGLIWSLNVVYAQVGLKLGADAFAAAARDFGIGQAIPFEFPVESGQLASNDDGLENPIALADTAFGQGELLVTPLHMALVMCAIANGGRIPKPILVDAVLNPDGSTSTRTEPSIWRRPISSQTADTVLSMLYESVGYGYARRAAIAGINVAGKTGTAESGREAPHGWFIGSAGVDAPAIVVSVCLDYGGEGGGLALDIGRELLAAAVGP